MLHNLYRLRDYFHANVDARSTSDDRRLLKKNENDPLYSALSRHRIAILAVYLFVLALFLLLVSAANPWTIPTTLDVIYCLIAGSPPPWSELNGAISGEPFGNLTLPYVALLIIVYIGLQGILLSGLGTIRLNRSARARWRTVFSFIALSVIATAIILASLALLWVLSQTMQNDFEVEPHFAVLKWLLNQGATRLIIGTWIFWTVVSLLYWWRRGSSSMLYRSVQILLAASWIEFSLALPIDIAARNRGQDCYCARGSWAALILVVPMLILLFGPGLYLLYLHERALSSSEPTRARAILRRKSKVYRHRSFKFKAETHVSNARTLSLLAIALGFVAFELGTFNNQRGTLLAEARQLIVIRYLKEKFTSDKRLWTSMLTEYPKSIKITLSKTSPDDSIPFDEISITPSVPPPPPPPPPPDGSPAAPPLPPPELPVSSEPSEISILGVNVPQQTTGIFKAEVKRNGESWSMSSFSLDNTSPDRLERILEDLQISSGESLSKLMSDIKESLIPLRPGAQNVVAARASSR
jgi:hypothetical protein